MRLEDVLNRKMLKRNMTIYQNGELHVVIYPTIKIAK